MSRHVVRPGDNIKSIIKKYKADLESLRLANSHVRDFESLSPGEVINIPGYTDGSLIHLEPRSFKPQLLSMLGISARQISEHTRLYQGTITKINEIRTKLRDVSRSDVNSIYCEFRALKKAEATAVVSYKLHELYFDNLGGRNNTVNGPILEAIVRDFGSYEFWEMDFRATGLASKGWAILGYDYDDLHLHNYGQDAHDDGSVIRCEPILVLDVYEHAYYLDYGTNCASYLDAFFNNIDWSVVNSRILNLKT